MVETPARTYARRFLLKERVGDKVAPERTCCCTETLFSAKKALVAHAMAALRERYPEATADYPQWKLDTSDGAPWVAVYDTSETPYPHRVLILARQRGWTGTYYQEMVSLWFEPVPIHCGAQCPTTTAPAPRKAAAVAGGAERPEPPAPEEDPPDPGDAHAQLMYAIRKRLAAMGDEEPKPKGPDESAEDESCEDESTVDESTVDESDDDEPGEDRPKQEAVDESAKDESAKDGSAEDEPAEAEDRSEDDESTEDESTEDESTEEGEWSSDDEDEDQWSSEDTGSESSDED